MTNEEIKQLIEKRPLVTGEYDQLAFDSFIFNCECGLRYQDLSTLSKADFTQIPEGYILKKDLHAASGKKRQITRRLAKRHMETGNAGKGNVDRIGLVPDLPGDQRFRVLILRHNHFQHKFALLVRREPTAAAKSACAVGMSSPWL